MTEERKNEIWAMLPSDFKKEAREFLMAYGESSAVLNDVLVALFGFNNFCAQAEEKPKEPTVAKNATVNDYAAYRLDLAKEIAVALINNTRKETRYGDILAHDAVKIANEIVKRLKETEE